VESAGGGICICILLGMYIAFGARVGVISRGSCKPQPHDMYIHMPITCGYTCSFTSKLPQCINSDQGMAMKLDVLLEKVVPDYGLAWPN